MPEAENRAGNMPKIEKPLKEIVRQNNFLGLSSPKRLATRLASGGEARLRDFFIRNTLGTIFAIY